jgi:hypothetical protein
MVLVNISIVVPREGGVSSTPRRRFSSSAPAITGSFAFADDDTEQEI